MVFYYKNCFSNTRDQTKNAVIFSISTYVLPAIASRLKARTIQNKRNYSTTTTQRQCGVEDTLQWQKLVRLMQGVAQDGREIIVFLEHRGRTWVGLNRSYRHLTTPHNKSVGRESRFVFSKLFARGWTPLEDEVSDSAFIKNLRVQQPVGLIVYVTGNNEADWQRRSNLDFVRRFKAPVVVVKPQNLKLFYPGYENQAYLTLNVDGASSPYLLDIAYYLRGLAAFYCSRLSAGSFVSGRFRNEAAFHDMQSRWVSLMRGLIGIRRASFRRVRYSGRKVLQRR